MWRLCNGSEADATIQHESPSTVASALMIYTALLTQCLPLNLLGREKEWRGCEANKRLALEGMFGERYDMKDRRTADPYKHPQLFVFQYSRHRERRLYIFLHQRKQLN